MSELPGIPHGDELTLVMQVRRMIEQAGEAAGLEHTGSGVGFGGADVSFSDGKRNIWIEIRMTESEAEDDGDSDG